MPVKPIEFIPYQQHEEPSRRAGITTVDFDFASGRFSDDEIQMLGHLIAAANEMNAVFRDQFNPSTPKIQETLQAMLDTAKEDEGEPIRNYLYLLCLQNAPWALLPRKNHLLQLAPEKALELAKQAGVEESFNEIREFLFSPVSLSDRANYYPEDLSEQELEELGKAGRCVNASVLRDESGKPYSVLNEKRYRPFCERAISHLKEARSYSSNISFQLYLDAKIEELKSGTEQARRLADYHWVRHDSPIDIIISTAIEVYLDNWKNAKGAASGNVTVLNRDADALLKSIISNVPDLEKNAPWTHRRTEIDPEALPRLKFVDVATWSGDYVTGPMTTIAQSLPNDEWVGKNIGTVNMVYRNTGKAVHSISGDLIAKEFLVKEVVDTFADQLFEAGQVHSALHEIGHTTGKQDPEHQGEPRDYLEAEYSPLEEARAELFGMWAAERLSESGVISKELAMASHYSMLLSMITSLKFEPNQAHTQARNMMWHYFMDHGAIESLVEEGKERYRLNFENVSNVICDMLKTVADLKAAGDKQSAFKLRETYCYSDPKKAEIEERTKESPLGRGLIFPQLVKKDGKYTRENVYPEFCLQQKFTVAE